MVPIGCLDDQNRAGMAAAANEPMYWRDSQGFDTKWILDHASVEFAFLSIDVCMPRWLNRCASKYIKKAAPARSIAPWYGLERDSVHALRQAFSELPREAHH